MGFLYAFEAELAAENKHGFKEGRCVLASADSDTNGLEGLPGLQAKVSGGCSKSLVERVVVEGCGG